MRRWLLVLLLVLIAVPAAGAAGWKRVTTADQSSIDQPGLARTADGVLHLAWSRATGPNTEELHHPAIARNGRLGATSTIAAGWTGFANAAVVVEPAGLRAFVGAIRSTTPGEPNDELNTLLSAGRAGERRARLARLSRQAGPRARRHQEVRLGRRRERVPPAGFLVPA